ncbi:PAS domain S-box-containing protein/diguanylate cyclase (GGDEF)-like protein [Motilibacter peucedani]|uniref:PAS domain S-box-containing protein/diguanylate cyclase (GGDEF)-like protein n=1 Tax=Motilibacter peucedani TaxID=598650 RepID=A0A420XTH3_9ACTN|nr:diguanylate cyclase [Motilibacter peucedani]RKS79969.1 PAS domain S-box-containing protein/diguanylate cyclase (GGDEF)-like protein [Motilibacter peucedani]
MDVDLDQVCFSNLLLSSPEAVFFKDLENRFLLVSRAQAARLGLDDPRDAVGRTDADFFSSEHAELAAADERAILAGGPPIAGKEEHVVTATGEHLWLSVWKYPLLADDGTRIGTYGMAHDITRRVEAERQLADRAGELAVANAELARVQEEMRTLLDGSPDAMCRLDTSMRWTYLNPTALAMLGLVDTRGLLGSDGRALGLPDDALAAIEQGASRSIETGLTQETEFLWARSSGERWYHGRFVPERAVDGTVTGVILAIRDDTDRHAVSVSLTHRATHDALTGLMNRTTLTDDIDLALHGPTAGSSVALLFVDLDRFKDVNDTYGHAYGDEILREAARRLRACSREGDSVARLGGDEFVMLCPGLRTAEAAQELASRVQATLSQPYWCDGELLHIGASVGCAVTEPGASTPAQLLAYADQQMYAAKRRARR